MLDPNGIFTHRTPHPPPLTPTHYYYHLPSQVVPGTVELVEMVECPGNYHLYEPPCPGAVSHAPGASRYDPGATPGFVTALLFAAASLL